MKLVAKWSLLLTAGLVAIIYAQTFSYDYALDDYLLIVDNEIVKAGLSRIKELFSTPMTWGVGYNDGLYRPIPLLTHALEIELNGAPSPAIGHFINVLLYTVLCVLLFFLAKKLFPSFSTFWLLALIMLYAAHPLHTEVVANIKSRDEILGLLFSVSAMLLALQFTQFKKWPYFLASLICFFLALLSKESALVFVVLIPLGYGSFIKPDRLLIQLQVLGLGLVSAAYLWIRNVVITELVPAVEITNMYSKLANTLAPTAGLEKFGMVNYLVAKYFFMGLIPIKQAYEYSFNMIPVLPPTDIRILASLFFNAFLIGVMIYLWRKQKVVSFSLWFFFGSIALFSNLFILIGVTFAERFAFVSSFGSVLLLVSVCHWIQKKYQIKEVYMFSMLGILLLFYTGKSFVRAQVWENNETLFIGDLPNNFNSVKAKYNAATQYSRLSREVQKPEIKRSLQDSAIALYEAALVQYPIYVDANNNLGNIYLEREEFEKAIAIFDKNMARKEVNVNTTYNRAVAYFNTKQFEKAIIDFEKFLSVNRYALKNVPLAHYFLGNAYGEIGNFDKAIVHLKEAVALNPKFWEAYLDLGKAFGIMNNPNLAIETLKQGLVINPNSVQLLNNLAISYMITAQYDLAYQIGNVLLELEPNNQAYLGLVQDAKRLSNQ